MHVHSAGIVRHVCLQGGPYLGRSCRSKAERRHRGGRDFYGCFRRLTSIPTGWYGSGVEHATPVKPAQASARDKLLDAALSLIRAKGYSATSVDDLCAAAGVTKGAFFHHFKSKEVLAVAAADHWSEKTGAFFAAAPYHQHKDPLERVLGYLDFRKAILK